MLTSSARFRAAAIKLSDIFCTGERELWRRGTGTGTGSRNTPPSPLLPPTHNSHYFWYFTVFQGRHAQRAVDYVEQGWETAVQAT